MFNAKKKEKTPQPEVRSEPRPAERQQARTPSPRKEAEARPSRSGGDSAKPSTLNPNLTFEGDLKFTGTVHVDCVFRGRIVTDDKLVVGAAARVEADVAAGVVEISGNVTGNVKASKSVKILSGGEVHGNIETPAIAMDEGVVFEGMCTRPAAMDASRGDVSASRPRATAAATSSPGASAFGGDATAPSAGSSTRPTTTVTGTL